MAMKNKNKDLIVISGYYGFNNCGDEAILSAMIHRFSQKVPKHKMVVLSKNPGQTKSKYQVDAIGRLDLLSLLKKLKKAQVLISGGGGLLQDITGRGLSVSYYLGLILVARISNIPCIVFAQGIGPITKKWNKIMIKKIFNCVQSISVRDNISKVLLTGLGIKREAITVHPDAAFLLGKKPVSRKTLSKYQLEPLPSSLGKGAAIGMIVRNCPQIKKDYQNKIKQIARIADHLIIKYQAKLIFIPFQRKNETMMIHDILDYMSQSAKCFDETLTPNQMLEFISCFSLIVGMRYHAIIFATMTHRPFIALNYDPKVHHFVTSIGYDKLLLDIEQLSISAVDEKLSYVEENLNEITSDLSRINNQNKTQIFWHTEKILQFIRNISD